MNLANISTKWKEFYSRRKWILWAIIILLLFSWNYYSDYFSILPSVFLSFLLVLELILMIGIGYVQLSKKPKFPRWEFGLWTLAFSVFRWLVVFFVLQHYLPDWTVFHYPGRSVFYLVLTSMAFIFTGYSYSIYEWGLAARNEFALKTSSQNSILTHPVKIRSEGKTVHLLPQEIIYLEAKGEYINYITTQSNHMCFQRMKAAETQLKHYGLMRAHRSFIINPIKILSHTSTELTMSNNQKIPISATYRNELLKSIEE